MKTRLSPRALADLAAPRTGELPLAASFADHVRARVRKRIALNLHGKREPSLASLCAYVGSENSTPPAPRAKDGGAA